MGFTTEINKRNRMRSDQNRLVNSDAIKWHGYLAFVSGI